MNIKVCTGVKYRVQKMQRSIEPSRDYILPFGKANVVVNADKSKIENGESCCIITYGMGVYWAKAAAKISGQIEIVDLRTLFPLDEEMIFESVKSMEDVWCLLKSNKTIHLQKHWLAGSQRMF